jgi:thiol:disulfide interchange protein
VADWTNYDPAIARFISGYGRSGIPLYLMYPGDPDREPLLLPQLLTRATVLEALQAVSRKGETIAEELAANDPLAAAESR